MPMIDVYAPAGLFPTESQRQLVEELTRALLQAEGVPAASPYLENTGAYLHVLDAPAIQTAARSEARTVRIQILTPPGALEANARPAFIQQATDIVARLAADTEQRARTWVLLTEAVEAGWGVAGAARTSADLAAARARSAVPDA
jgi:phenylpyruvate tautomerase PptA (4-oxalocrotonate tautomerase family)